jgi:long-chain acyl-CoA synthetase
MQNLSKLTIKEVVNTSTENYSNNIALAEIDGRKVTYKELKEKVERLSEFLKSRGIVKGDRVAILSENSINWGISYLAITTIGAIAVPIMTEFQPTEIKHILMHSEAKAIFISSKLYEKIEDLELDFLDQKILLDNFSVIPDETKSDILKDAVRDGKIEFAKILDKALNYVGLKNEEIEENDLAALLYTSGTTGNSKGVMLTQRNIVYDAKATINLVSINQTDVLLSILPLFHTIESTLGFITPLMVGATIYYMKKPPTPTSLVAALGKVKPTVMLAVPLIIEKIYKGKILKEINKSGIVKKAYSFPFARKIINKKAGEKLMETFGGRIKMFCMGGAPLSKEVEQFLREGNFPYAIGYGLTETAPLVTGTPPDRAKFGSCGDVLEGMEVKIDSPDPHKIEGEVLIKGPNVMKGYYRDEERTKEVFTEDGWFRSGDLGIIDKDGYLYIKGRSKNMILRANGKNIYPEEIESVINQQEFVLESVVIDRNGKLVALVHLDQEAMDDLLDTGKMNDSEARKVIDDVLKKIMEKTNSLVPSFSRLNFIELQPEPFIKTPTHKIKRFLYK